MEKQVAGDGADKFAPDSFPVTLACTSAGQRVPLPSDVRVQTLTPGTPVTVFDLPYHATCTLTERGDQGQTSSTSGTATVQRDVSDFEFAVVTNTYDFASLAITKTVDSTAVDQDGNPIPYGPFTVVVRCAYLGHLVYADGYGPGNPMTADLSNGQTVTFTELPAGAQCRIRETDDKGATSTTIVTTVGSGGPTPTEGTTTAIELAPDSGGDTTNTAVITNQFGVGAINVIKKVTGAVAERYGAGPFTLAMTCVLDDATGTRTVWDGTIELGGDAPLRATVTDIAAGATCTFAEPDDGGATTATIDPTGPIPVDANETATVTATNSFDPAALFVDKEVDGTGAADAPDTFSVEVTCSADGSVLPGFPVTVDVSPGTPTKVPTLRGAECTARETDTGEATAVTYDPAASDGSDGSGPVVATDDPQNPATITITNTFGSAGAGPTGATAPSPPLAGTGEPITMQLWWGIALLVSGVALIVLAGLRRRRGRHLG
jgi:hypothetical protein